MVAMGLSVRTVDYYYIRVEDKLGRAWELLSQLADENVNLLAFSAVPYGDQKIEFTVFPEDPRSLQQALDRLGMKMIGPQHALLVQGDDQMGAFAHIHRRLLDAKVNVYASSGVTDGQGFYGYVIYVSEADFPAAAKAIESGSPAWRRAGR